MKHPISGKARERWNELVQSFLDCKENIKANFWKMASISYEIYSKFGGKKESDRKKVLKEFAAEVSFSLSYVYELAKIYDTFRDEYMQSIHNIEPSHYRVAIHSKDPHGWIERASRDNLSVRKLGMLIRAHEGTRTVSSWAYYIGKAEDVFTNLMLDYEGKKVEVKVRVV